jgi:hypothetical protein
VVGGAQCEAQGVGRGARREARRGSATRGARHGAGGSSRLEWTDVLRVSLSVFESLV